MRKMLPNYLKEYLQEAPILRYPDPAASYTLYTDASKYAYAGLLTQTIEDTDHPVAYCKRSLQRISTKLGGTNKRSVCHLHVSEKAKFLS